MTLFCNLFIERPSYNRHKCQQTSRFQTKRWYLETVNNFSLDLFLLQQLNNDTADIQQ